MHVQRPHERRTLSAVVVQPEQLEAAVVLGAQVAFYIVLVAKHLQASAGHEEALCLLSHAVVAQQVLEYLEVACLIDARVLRYLLEVGEDTPLSHFMSHDRVRVGLLLLVVDGILQQLIVVVVAVRRSLIPVQASCSGLDMIVGPLFPSPATAHAGSAVDAVGVVLPHRLHPVLAIGHPVSGRFVACRHHAERRMMSVGIDDSQSFVQKILVDGHPSAQPHAVVRPGGTFGLQVETQPVGHAESRFRRAIGMEANVVEAVLLALAEHSLPRRFVCRRVARLGERAVAHRAAQEERTSVDVELLSPGTYLTQSESHADGHALISDRSRVELRMKLVPTQGVVA